MQDKADHGKRQPMGQRGVIWVEAGLGKWCPEDKREVQDGTGLEVETQGHHPGVYVQVPFCQGSCSTHALALFTQLSLESLARTELVSLGRPWVRHGVIFIVKRMFHVAFGVLQVGWKDGTRQQGWAGGGWRPWVLFFSSLPFF